MAKKLSSPAKVIIIRGPLGVGKSSVAKKLAATINAHYISIDRALNKRNLDSIESGKIPLKNCLAVNRKIIPIIRKHLASNKTTVIDGNFYYRAQIEDLISRLGAPCHIFTLNASLRTCITRDQHRQHAYGSGATKKVYYLTRKFNSGTRIKTDNLSVMEITAKLYHKINSGKS